MLSQPTFLWRLCLRALLFLLVCERSRNTCRVKGILIAQDASSYPSSSCWPALSCFCVCLSHLDALVFRAWGKRRASGGVYDERGTSSVTNAPGRFIRPRNVSSSCRALARQGGLALTLECNCIGTFEAVPWLQKKHRLEFCDEASIIPGLARSCRGFGAHRADSRGERDFAALRTGSLLVTSKGGTWFEFLAQTKARGFVVMSGYRRAVRSQHLHHDTRTLALAGLGVYLPRYKIVAVHVRRNLVWLLWSLSGTSLSVLSIVLLHTLESLPGAHALRCGRCLGNEVV